MPRPRIGTDREDREPIVPSPHARILSETTGDEHSEALERMPVLAGGNSSHAASPNEPRTGLRRFEARSGVFAPTIRSLKQLTAQSILRSSDMEIRCRADRWAVAAQAATLSMLARTLGKRPAMTWAADSLALRSLCP